MDSHNNHVSLNDCGDSLYNHRKNNCKIVKSHGVSIYNHTNLFLLPAVVTGQGLPVKLNVAEKYIRA